MDVCSPLQRCFIRAVSFCRNWVIFSFFFSISSAQPLVLSAETQRLLREGQMGVIFWGKAWRKCRWMAFFLLLKELSLVLGGATSVFRHFYGSTGSQVGAPSKGTSGLPRRSPHIAALATNRALFPASCPTLGSYFSWLWLRLGIPH